MFKTKNQSLYDRQYPHADAAKSIAQLVSKKLRAVSRLLIVLLFAPSLLPAADATAIPASFPRFDVPGHEKEMAALRAMFWLHYPSSGPQATLWDEWMTDVSLWPAVTHNDAMEKFHRRWRETLSARPIDPEGYVSPQQHASVAHPQGWPFPFWNQGRGGFGWHFSFKNTVSFPYRCDVLNSPAEWNLSGARDAGVNADGWKVELTNSNAIVTLREWKFEAFNSPFIQLRWTAMGLGKAQPYIEWNSPDAPEFSAQRRLYFDAAEGTNMVHTIIPMYRHPRWQGDITQLRIGLNNAHADGAITIQACFSTYDTRHNVNGQSFVRGCANYFWWTRDLAFLRQNINRMRLALGYLMTKHQTLARNVVVTDWIGHDGRSGFSRPKEGAVEIHSGRGIGNNYWDLLPFGNLDAYATIQYYDMLRTMVRVEREIRTHPEWQIPNSPLAYTPEFLERHAVAVKAEGNRLFWQPGTKRFAACIDVDGQAYDYGFTFLNYEAVFYDFATDAHARDILRWISGERIVKGDTSTGADIYHWRFAPRATTKRNLEWYYWCWHKPEELPWGGQVQDGGAVLGFSYHDLMARLKTRGPDDAWQRLQEILKWFAEVQAVGGYRKYYDGKREGTLQGGGTAGGLGMDVEFIESALVPQVMLHGFLGFTPAADGFSLNPRLPRAWPELSVDRIRFQNVTLRIRVTPKTVEIWREGRPMEPWQIRLPTGAWRISSPGANAVSLHGVQDFTVTWNEGDVLRLERP